MTTEQKPRRTFQGVIQSIGEEKRGEVISLVVMLAPRPGMEWADRFSGRDLSLKEGFKPGDSAVLTLARGRPKVAAPQSRKDYWEDIVGITRAEVTPSPGPQPSPTRQGTAAPFSPPEASISSHLLETAQRRPPRGPGRRR